MAATDDPLGPGRAVLVVDVQRDFCPGGALPVPDGDAVVPELNRWIAAARASGCAVYASRDWHPRGHPSFEARGGPWPPHCVQDTEGAAFHPDLALPEDAVLVSKGTRFDKDQYSAFDETGLAQRLRDDGIEGLVVGGLAGDVCVRATVLDARRAGLEVRLALGAVRFIDPEAREAVLAELAEAGVSLVGAP